MYRISFLFAIFIFSLSKSRADHCANSSLGGFGNGSYVKGMMSGRDFDYEIVSLPSEVGKVGILDSPFYDCKTGNLYFADLFGQYIFRYDEKTKQIYYAVITGWTLPAYVIPVRGHCDLFFVGLSNSVYKVQWDGVSKTATALEPPVFTVEPGTDHHMNQGIAGPKGGFYTGTFGTTLCGEEPIMGFYRWTRTRGVEKLPGSYKTTNSLGIDNKRNILYHLDGCTQELISFKFNRKTGELCCRRVILKNFGLPNTVAPIGCAINQKGHLHIGSYRLGRFFVIDPFKRKILDEIEMPTRFATSCSFGGDGQLYMLSAGLDADILIGQPTNVTVEPPGGSLFILKGFGERQCRYKPCI